MVTNSVTGANRAERFFSPVLSTLTFPKSMPRQLVIQFARFGDIIQTGRLVHALEREGETHLCVDRSLTALAESLYPQCHVHGVAAHGGDSAAENLAFNHSRFAELASLAFDAVYNLNYSGMNRALATLFPPEIVRGYKVINGQSLRERWMRLAFRWTGHRHSAPLNLVDFWGLLAPDPLPPAEVHPEAKPGGRGLGVVLAGRQARRSLPPEVLAPLVQARFEALGGPPVFLLGSASERAMGRELMNHLSRRVGGKTTNLAGRTDWNALIECVTGLDEVLSPDTGTMHLAARLGVPVQAMFLSSAWAWETGPYGLGHHVWQAAPECAPCAEAAVCHAGVRCLEPFRSPGFLLALAGSSAFSFGKKDEHSQRLSLPPNLMKLESSFDALGQIWKTEEHDSGKVSRQALRALLEEYHGCSKKGPFPQAGNAVAGALYTETDWIVPDTI